MNASGWSFPLLSGAFLLMGLPYRQRHGIGNIGVESALLPLIYRVGVWVVFILA